MGRGGGDAGGVGGTGGCGVASGRSVTRGSGTVSGAGGGTGLAAAGGTGVGGTTGAAGRVGSGRAADAGAAAAVGCAAGCGVGPASRDNWLTRDRSSSISRSCDSTTLRSVSSRVRVLRADTQATMGSTKGTASRISAKNRISTVPCLRTDGRPPGAIHLCWGLAILHGADVADKLHSHRTPRRAGRLGEKP
jgi:hypothetical protein